MKSIRKYYEQMGADDFYKKYCNNYENPHYPIIKELIKDIEKDIDGSVLDLCCGSGEVTLCLNGHNVKGLDPYTYDLYKKNTGKDCYKYNFKDIVQGKLTDRYDTIICCFALHLCEESMLPTLLWQLNQISHKLIIISPHKRPDCNNLSGWELNKTIKRERITAKIYIHK